MDQFHIMEVGKPYYLKLKAQERLLEGPRVAKSWNHGSGEGVHKSRESRSKSMKLSSLDSSNELNGRLSRMARTLHESTEELLEQKHRERRLTTSQVTKRDALNESKGRNFQKLPYQNIPKSDGKAGEAPLTKAGERGGRGAVQKFTSKLRNSCRCDDTCVASAIDLTSAYQDSGYPFGSSNTFVTEPGRKSLYEASSKPTSKKVLKPPNSFKTPEEIADDFEKRGVSSDSFVVVLRLNGGNSKEVWMSNGSDLNDSVTPTTPTTLTTPASVQDRSITHLKDEQSRNFQYKRQSLGAAILREDAARNFDYRELLTEEDSLGPSIANFGDKLSRNVEDGNLLTQENSQGASIRNSREDIARNADSRRLTRVDNSLGASITNLREEPSRSFDYRRQAGGEDMGNLEYSVADGGETMVWQKATRRRLEPSRFRREHLERVRGMEGGQTSASNSEGMGKADGVGKADAGGKVEGVPTLERARSAEGFRSFERARSSPGFRLFEGARNSERRRNFERIRSTIRNSEKMLNSERFPNFARI